MCVCVGGCCIQVCVCAPVWKCAFVWRSEVDTGHLPHLLYILFKMGVSREPEVCLAGHEAPRVRASLSRVLRLQVHSGTLLNFLICFKA